MRNYTHLPSPLEKLEKLHFFQIAPTIPDYRQLEKTRKKKEVSGAAYSESIPISHVSIGSNFRIFVTILEFLIILDDSFVF